MPSPARLGLRAWLEEKLKNNEFPVLQWFDETKGWFSISWKHASRHGWNQKDAVLFKAWAQYTGRYKEGDIPEPKIWKATFRCAVNASSDIRLVRNRGECKGKNAHRVYAFSKRRRSKKYVAARKPGIKLHDHLPKLHIKQEPIENGYICEYQPRPSKYRRGYGSVKYSKNIKKEEEGETVVPKIEVNKPDITSCVSTEPTETTRLFSFSEIIEKIPNQFIGLGRSSVSFSTNKRRSSDDIFLVEKQPSQQFTQTEPQRNIQDNETPLSIIENCFRFPELNLGANITVADSDCFDDLTYNDKFDESATSGESDVDMKDIFDDTESYQSISSESSHKEWNKKYMNFNESEEEAVYSCNNNNRINLNHSISVNNDPFLGSTENSSNNEVIEVITQSLIMQSSIDYD